MTSLTDLNGKDQIHRVCPAEKQIHVVYYFYEIVNMSTSLHVFHYNSYLTLENFCEMINLLFLWAHKRAN